MRVTFHVNDPQQASTRLRCVIPAIELKKLGVDIVADGDILVWGKHSLDLEQAKSFKVKVYDICDDHFSGSVSGYYRTALKLADIVTCNSDAMRFRIHQMGRIATVIPDPYETERKEPSWGEGILWFGHESNLQDLYRVMPKLDNVTILSTPISAGIQEWSMEAQKRALERCAVVILPTGKSPCKSANRLLEAVMAGKFVVAEPLPAYEQFKRFMWVGDIAEGVKWAMANKGEALERVKDCQVEFSHPFSKEEIGKRWLELLKTA